MNRLYLVTGACGHVGNTLVKQLVANGEKVRGLVLPKEDTSPLAGLPDVELVRGDVRDIKSLEPFFDGAGLRRSRLYPYRRNRLHRVQVPAERNRRERKGHEKHC